MHIRIRLRIGDLRQVLTEALQLPSFIKLKLTFKLPGMPLPVTFPKAQRMHRVMKQLA